MWRAIAFHKIINSLSNYQHENESVIIQPMKNLTQNAETIMEYYKYV
jgi:hypothetical protein